MTADLHSQFPILTESAHGHPLVWLDNAATTQKPRAVIDAVSDYYTRANANVHRASHALSARATHAFEEARETVRTFMNAQKCEEIIWTRGATEALNLLAHSWGHANLKAGDEIILSTMDHHANIVPWQQLAEQTGAVIRVIPLTDNGELDQLAFQQLLSTKTKLLSVTHVSNALGTVNPVKEMITAAKAKGATTIIDGAQAVAHFPVDVQELGCDFYVFSGHKVYGPTGIGVLYGRLDLLQAMPPWQTGGEMIERVSFSGTTFNQPPFRFEAGTPNIAGVIGLAEAITFLQQQNRPELQRHEQQLREQLEQALVTIPGLTLIGTAREKTAVVSFVIDGLHNQDIGVLLDQQGIAVRTGHHCAMPLMEALGLSGTVRASLGCYNTQSDIESLVKALKQVVQEYQNQDADNTRKAIEHTTHVEQTDLPTLFAGYPTYSHDNLNRLEEQLLSCRNWQDRYRQIMLLSKQLPPLSEQQRQDDARLHGCESVVWLHAHHDTQSNSLHFALDSDSRVIKGLIVIIMTCLNSQSPTAILNAPVEELFTRLELTNHLSPSRGNGLRAIVQEIRDVARRYR